MHTNVSQLSDQTCPCQ